MADINVYEIPQLANAMAYEEMKEELKREHWGKWVVIHDMDLLGTYSSFDEAQQATQEAGFDELKCCIRQVGVEPLPIILLGT